MAGEGWSVGMGVETEENREPTVDPGGHRSASRRNRDGFFSRLKGAPRRRRPGGLRGAELVVRSLLAGWKRAASDAQQGAVPSKGAAVSLLGVKAGRESETHGMQLSHTLHHAHHLLSPPMAA